LTIGGLWGQSRAFTLALHQLVAFGLWDYRGHLNAVGYDAHLAPIAKAVRAVALLLAMAALWTWLGR
jgi:hypothetical protein